jgi:hypothetical protein
MRELAERLYFRMCRALGGLLRSAKYSKAEIVEGTASREPEVRKRRAFYAPLLVWLGDPLMKILNTGVRVLPQREWEGRERLMHGILRRGSIRVDADGVLVLPLVPGRTLAELLEDTELEERVRHRAIEHAVVALADFHRLGCTHGDAMAENVLVDLQNGVAHWFDFETVHDSRRSTIWRRADDVRALIVTCVMRATPENRADTLQGILAAYPDEDVVGLLAAYFSSVFRRPLIFHLGQAGLSLDDYRELARLSAGRRIRRS